LHENIADGTTERAKRLGEKLGRWIEISTGYVSWTSDRFDEYLLRERSDLAFGTVGCTYTPASLARRPSPR
jgi:hypothetical protein